jgi:hypothetical protein
LEEDVLELHRLPRGHGQFLLPLAPLPSELILIPQESFYQTFDSAGWSVFRGDYKYNDECKVLFMTSNLIAGFIQRTEEIRKWLFGTLTIRGVEGCFSFSSIVLPQALTSSS